MDLAGAIPESVPEAVGAPVGRGLRDGSGKVEALLCRMQIRELPPGRDRPICPCNHCHRVYAHGSYRRYAGVDGSERVHVPRWICTQCARTISLLPENRLPYWALSVSLLGAWLDAVLLGNRAPPEPSERERGCVGRSLGRFTQRIPSLCNTLGQLIGIISPSSRELWQELLQLGKLGEILRVLSREFKISLLGDYVCLRPWGK